jgi:hypothetical protein
MVKETSTMRSTIVPIGAALLGGAAALAWTATAGAQQEVYTTPPPVYVTPAPQAVYATPAPQETIVRHGLAAPTNSFELKVGAAYTQGFGMLTPRQSILDVAGAGIAADLDLDYRADPHVSVGVQGEYQEFANNTTNNTASRGFAGNIGVTFHGNPASRGDPWLRFGTGYRLLWNVDPTNTVGGQFTNVGQTQLVHGFEVGKLILGYDIRVDPQVALAPAVGADLNIFAWQLQNGVSTTLSTAQVGMYVFAGLQGRFDIGPTTDTHAVATRY